MQRQISVRTKAHFCVNMVVLGTEDLAAALVGDLKHVSTSTVLAQAAADLATS